MNARVIDWDGDDGEEEEVPQSDPGQGRLGQSQGGQGRCG